jgi:hypothetical protein
MEKKSIINKLVSCTSGRESSSVKLITDLKTCESSIVIEKSYRKYYPVKDYEKVMELYNQIKDGINVDKIID